MTPAWLPTARTAVELAMCAPSVHNLQPWRFDLYPNHIDLFADRRRCPPGTDQDGRDLMISCGIVLHHLRVALGAFGYLPVTVRLPDTADPDHIARIERVPQPAHRSDLALAVAIPRRRSDRRPYRDRPVPDGHLAELTRVAAQEGAILRVVTDPATRAALAGVDGVADNATPGGVGTLLLLGTRLDDARAHLRTGEAASAVLLAATQAKLATCSLSRPLGLPHTREPAPGDLVGGHVNQQLVLRVGWPSEQAALPPTGRRPVEEVLRVRMTPDTEMVRPGR